MCDACGKEAQEIDKALAEAQAAHPDLPWYVPIVWTPEGDAWRSDKGGYSITDLSNGEALLACADWSRPCEDAALARLLADLDRWKREPRRSRWL